MDMVSSIDCRRESIMYREKITKGHLQNSAKLQLQMVETETNIDSPSVARGLRYFSTQES
jgi:hypothetical protein